MWEGAACKADGPAPTGNKQQNTRKERGVKLVVITICTEWCREDGAPRRGGSRGVTYCHFTCRPCLGVLWVSSEGCCGPLSRSPEENAGRQQGTAAWVQTSVECRAFYACVECPLFSGDHGSFRLLTERWGPWLSLPVGAFMTKTNERGALKTTVSRTRVASHTIELTAATRHTAHI